MWPAGTSDDSWRYRPRPSWSGHLPTWHQLTKELAQQCSDARLGRRVAYVEHARQLIADDTFVSNAYTRVNAMTRPNAAIGRRNASLHLNRYKERSTDTELLIRSCPSTGIWAAPRRPHFNIWRSGTCLGACSPTTDHEAVSMTTERYRATRHCWLWAKDLGSIPETVGKALLAAGLARRSRGRPKGTE